MEWNQEPRNTPMHTWLVYYKGAKNIHWRKDSVFSRVWKTGQPYTKE